MAIGVIEKLMEELKRKVDEEKYVNVGKEAAERFCVSPERLRKAVEKLAENEDYFIFYVETIHEPNKCFMKILTKDVDINFKEMKEKFEKEFYIWG